MNIKNIILKTTTFLLISFQVLAQENNDFKPCGNKTYYPYYYQGNTEDFYQVKQHFKVKYNDLEYKDTPGNTGMIHITFNVNCKGETGNFTIETFDYNYKYCMINDDIKNKFVNLTKQLKVWQPIPEKQEVQNIHEYFIFKIKNGKLIDILLK